MDPGQSPSRRSPSFCFGSQQEHRSLATRLPLGAPTAAALSVASTLPPALPALLLALLLALRLVLLLVPLLAWLLTRQPRKLAGA